MEVDALRLHERKRVKAHPALRRHFAAELPDASAAEIARILISDEFCVAVLRGFFLQFPVDLLEIGVADDRLPAQDEPPLIRNVQRQVPERAGVRRDHFTDLAVAARDRLRELPALVSENDGEPVQLP